MSFDENLINNPSKGMPRLLEIMRALRDPEKGCPWDIEQNFKTIAPYTVEEAYEVADAIERENWEDLKNELGDLLLQTVYHTQIAEEENLFNFNDVINQISEKMIQRHPHVFGEENRNKSASQQIKDWELIKAKEMASLYASKSPIAAQMIKRSVNNLVYKNDESIMHMDYDQTLLTHETKDRKEAVTAFFEKREPDFKGD